MILGKWGFSKFGNLSVLSTYRSLFPMLWAEDTCVMLLIIGLSPGSRKLQGPHGTLEDRECGWRFLPKPKEDHHTAIQVSPFAPHDLESETSPSLSHDFPACRCSPLKILTAAQAEDRTISTYFVTKLSLQHGITEGPCTLLTGWSDWRTEWKEQLPESYSVFKDCTVIPGPAIHTRPRPSIDLQRSAFQ